MSGGSFKSVWDYKSNVKVVKLETPEGKDDLAPKFINLKGKSYEFTLQRF